MNKTNTCVATTGGAPAASSGRYGIVVAYLEMGVNLCRQKRQHLMSDDDRAMLLKVAGSRTSPKHHIERAAMLLFYDDGVPVKEIADKVGRDLTTVYRAIKKAALFGLEESLDDLQRAGRPAVITPEATAWIHSVSCQSPEEFAVAPI